MKKTSQAREDFINFLFELQKRKSIETYCPNSGCKCECCAKADEKVNPSIKIDPLLNELRSRYEKNPGEPGACLTKTIQILKATDRSIPNFPIIDTVTFKNGRPSALVYFDQKARLEKDPQVSTLKDFLLNRKLKLDIEYLKKQYKRENPEFFFILLDHQSEKLLKQFEKKIKAVHPSQRKVCSIQTKKKQTPDILNQTEFEALFDGKKILGGIHALDIEYLQLFPIIQGEEQYERVSRIYYFREKYQNHPHMKVAENFFSVWTQRNQTLQQLQQKFIKNTLKSPNEYLLYITFKIAIHFEFECDIRLDSFLLEFFRDKHNTINIRNIRYIQYTKKVGIYLKQNLFSQQRVIPQQDHIDLKSRMSDQFVDFQNKFKQLYQTQVDHMITDLMDLKKSDNTFKKITGSTVSFEDALNTKNKKLKKKNLQIN